MRRTFRRTTGPGRMDEDAGSSVPAIVGGIFTVVGIGLLLGSLALYTNSWRFIASATTAQGEVTELVRSRGRDGIFYSPIVRFRTAQGRVVEFASTSGSNPPAYSVGDAVEVLYDARRPEQASIAEFFSLWGAALILGFLGLIFSFIGTALLVFLFKGRVRVAARARDRVERESLRDFGRRIDARIREVRSEPGDAYRIVAQWHDPTDRKVYVFESDAIGFDPGEFLQETIGVYLDPSDPGRYLVDLSSLPTQGNTPDMAG